jgi:hypothetical protein
MSTTKAKRMERMCLDSYESCDDDLSAAIWTVAAALWHLSVAVEESDGKSLSQLRLSQLPN